jgi:hypothetical protein
VQYIGSADTFLLQVRLEALLYFINVAWIHAWYLPFYFPVILFDEHLNTWYINHVNLWYDSFPIATFKQEFAHPTKLTLDIPSFNST